MAALTANYNNGQTGGATSPIVFKLPGLKIADNVHIFQNSLVQFNPANGYVYPAGSANTADTHTYITLGRAVDEYDNTVVGHTAGALNVEVEQGAFQWDAGTSGDALTSANFFTDVYAIDDHTVGATSGSTTRAKAGILLGIDPITLRVIVSTAIAGSTT